jgi:DNA-binding transcriptional ArsR family regulator/uncharacterized protein YndB with AHSA1/START domain
MLSIAPERTSPPQTSQDLDLLFGALADATRRGIVERLAAGEATVSELAAPFAISLPAISRHLKVLERASLITRSQEGRWRRARLSPAPLASAATWLERHERLWAERLGRLDDHLASAHHGGADAPAPGADRDPGPERQAMSTTTTPQLALTRIFNAPRALVYRAFTDPDQFGSWWGPTGNALPRDEIDFDVRPGGYLQWKEVFPAEPDVWTRGRVDLTDVVDGELLDGVVRITGELPGGFEPFETRMRLEFSDEPDGRTRLEVSQWLPEHLASPSENGWGEAFSKLDALLASRAR